METDDYNTLIYNINEILNEIQILQFSLQKKLKIVKAKQEKENENKGIGKDEDDDDISSLISSPPKTIHKSASSLPEHLKLDEDSLKPPVTVRELAIRDRKEIDDLLNILSKFKKELSDFKTNSNSKLPDEDGDEDEGEPEKKRRQKKDGRKSKSKRRQILT